MRHAFHALAIALALACAVPALALDAGSGSPFYKSLRLPDADAGSGGDVSGFSAAPGLPGLRKRSLREKLGEILSIADTNADCTGQTDGRAAAQALLDQAGAAAGSHRVALGACKLKITSGFLKVPPGVDFYGPGMPGKTQSGAYTDVASSIILDPSAKVCVGRGASLRGMTVRASNLIDPSSADLKTLMANLYAIRDNMPAGSLGVEIGDCAGTHGSGSEATVQDVMILGFDRCLASTFNDLFSVFRVYGDCRSGFYFDNTYELGLIAENHMYPYLAFGPLDNYGWFGAYYHQDSIVAIGNQGGQIRLTIPAHPYSTGQKISVSGAPAETQANGLWTLQVIDGATVVLQGSSFAVGRSSTDGSTFGTVSPLVILREGIAFEGTNGFDHGTFNSPRAYGWLYCVQVNNSDHVAINDARCDYWGQAGRTDSVGIHIAGTSAASSVNNARISGFANGYSLDAAGGFGPFHQLVNPNFWGNGQRSILQQAGSSLIVNGGLFEDTHDASVFGYTNSSKISAANGINALKLGGAAYFGNNVVEYFSADTKSKIQADPLFTTLP